MPQSGVILVFSAENQNPQDDFYLSFYPNSLVFMVKIACIDLPENPSNPLRTIDSILNQGLNSPRLMLFLFRRQHHNHLPAFHFR